MACALLCSISSAFVRPRFLRESTTTLAVRLYDRQAHLATWPSQTRQFSSADDVVTSSKSSSDDEIPLYKCQGLLAVEKPLDWTSSDVVSYIRGILERDAKNRGANVTSFRARRNKSQKIKVGHGGTLDPLATGVLVIGVGKGTKELQDYLTGSKGYRAVGEFGFETTTLDMEGNVTNTGPIDHITWDSVENVLSEFVGTIKQIPPIFSALRKEGKKLYQSARKGVTADDMEIEAREVKIHNLNLVRSENVKLPKFEIKMECGGGTYVRSLIRDIGYRLDTVATTTVLERTKQGQFLLEHCLPKSDWNANNIYVAIEKRNHIRETEAEGISPE